MLQQVPFDHQKLTFRLFFFTVLCKIFNKLYKTFRLISCLTRDMAAGFIGQLQRQVVKGFWRFMLYEACHHVTACHVLYFYLASPRRDESSPQKDVPFYLYLS